MADVSIKRGSRAFITGTSGSGKSTFALRLCEAMPSPLVILDTKYDPGISTWAKRHGVKVTSKMPEWRKITDDVVIRPPPDWLAEPDDIDWWLGGAFDCRYVPSIYIDEGYQVGATASRMGHGVTSLWTRGRAFGFRMLLGAQRPAWLSRFVMTESDVLFIGRLNSKHDRKTMIDATGENAAGRLRPHRHFLYVRQDGTPPVELRPLAISENAADNNPETRRASRVRRERVK